MLYDIVQDSDYIEKAGGERYSTGDAVQGGGGAIRE